MKASNFLIKTQKESPRDADSINASLLIRGGYVQKQMAGVYALLPLGFRVYRKIENIIRQEMDSIGSQELLMNVLQPRDLWEETGRWDDVKDIMYRVGNDVGLAPTHEEQITDIARKKISSYRDLPLSLYQIQVKFRNEPRAKSGLLRGREFMMKDMYSFHASEDDFEKYYLQVTEAYKKVFSRIGLDVKITSASGGSISNQKSDEFHVLSPVGEDVIFCCEKCDYSVNQEIAEINENDKCPKCGEKIEKTSTIELGHIFYLKDKYSLPMKASFVDSDGQDRPLFMGCYGLGLTRALATLVEVYYDQQNSKMVWPKSVAPFTVEIISLNKNDEAEKIYKELLKNNIDVLYDDRELTAGEKFADADLIGAPVKIIVSEKSLAAGGAEINGEIIALDKISGWLE